LRETSLDIFSIKIRAGGGRLAVSTYPQNLAEYTRYAFSHFRKTMTRNRIKMLHRDRYAKRYHPRKFWWSYGFRHFLYTGSNFTLFH